ncbi:hypothetical protein Fcan01_20033 [Folsomia candida]|uniref:Uncharacterized protein n=1 Tax=Folsomia candida TaxID=158441 RepID=A0A226DM99_FOLCA|nr:hypothetical protein Fcan01_20033 [Folsomia candida]
MAFNIPYHILCNAVGGDLRGENYCEAKSVYGMALIKLGEENTFHARKFLKEVISFCIEEVNCTESTCLSPLTPFIGLRDSEIISVLEDELKQKPTNYVVPDPNSFYGNIVTKLGLQNTRANREYLREFVKTSYLEFLQRKRHQEILTSFSLSDNHNVHAKHGTSLYGDVALRLNLPNIDVVRFSLSRWSKHFSNFVGTTGNERKGRRNEPITRRPPRKRPHLDIEDIPSSSMLQFFLKRDLIRLSDYVILTGIMGKNVALETHL